MQDEADQISLLFICSLNKRKTVASHITHLICSLLFPATSDFLIFISSDSYLGKLATVLATGVIRMLDFSLELGTCLIFCWVLNWSWGLDFYLEWGTAVLAGNDLFC